LKLQALEMETKPTPPTKENAYVEHNAVSGGFAF
jgi:hypothetical protein